MKQKTNLASCRKETPLLQQDVAHILYMDTGLYNRYEKGRRPPTLDIILGFHILFEANVKDLFSFRYMQLQERIITQSIKLIEQLKTELSPKSTYSIAYLEKLVNRLSNKGYE